MSANVFREWLSKGECRSSGQAVQVTPGADTVVNKKRKHEGDMPQPETTEELPEEAEILWNMDALGDNLPDATASNDPSRPNAQFDATWTYTAWGNSVWRPLSSDCGTGRFTLRPHNSHPMKILQEMAHSCILKLSLPEEVSKPLDTETGQLILEILNSDPSRPLYIYARPIAQAIPAAYPVETGERVPMPAKSCAFGEAPEPTEMPSAAVIEKLRAALERLMDPHQEKELVNKCKGSAKVAIYVAPEGSTTESPVVGLHYWHFDNSTNTLRDLSRKMSCPSFEQENLSPVYINMTETIETDETEYLGAEALKKIMFEGFLGANHFVDDLPATAAAAWTEMEMIKFLIEVRYLTMFDTPSNQDVWPWGNIDRHEATVCIDQAVLEKTMEWKEGKFHILINALLAERSPPDVKHTACAFGDRAMVLMGLDQFARIPFRTGQALTMNALFRGCGNEKDATDFLPQPEAYGESTVIFVDFKLTPEDQQKTVAWNKMRKMRKGSRNL
ncbi:hypothetical protein B484DRAFT_397739 [Ochromonadaceae sp. CCMP2298]|nr:hypothetical protein B484DRAFT_397739 [Ochromonadaceae sp. CCMP2298]